MLFHHWKLKFLHSEATSTPEPLRLLSAVHCLLIFKASRPGIKLVAYFCFLFKGKVIAFQFPVKSLTIWVLIIIYKCWTHHEIVHFQKLFRKINVCWYIFFPNLNVIGTEKVFIKIGDYITLMLWKKCNCILNVSIMKICLCGQKLNQWSCS